MKTTPEQREQHKLMRRFKNPRALVARLEKRTHRGEWALKVLQGVVDKLELRNHCILEMQHQLRLAN